MATVIETDTKLEAANIVLGVFTDSHIERRKGGWYVCWERHGEQIAKRWYCRGQEFYPIWHKRWGHGGTASTALSQLIRWLRDQPVLPISSWRLWGGEAYALFRFDTTVDVPQTLLDAGYPEHANCVLCGQQLDGGFDWWSLRDVTGPCCHWTRGCRQKPNSEGTDG